MNDLLSPRIGRKLLLVTFSLAFLLFLVIVLGLAIGSTEHDFYKVFNILFSLSNQDSILKTIIWEIRFPRVLLAAATGATLGIGGLVFQALLRNPLAEPYILGISGGSAVGAVLGMMLGWTMFPGVAALAFLGSMSTLFLVIFISSGRGVLRENSLLLAGVMVNAFCSAIIMFLISITQHTKVKSVLFWLMGDLSKADPAQVLGLTLFLLPCFIFVFTMNRPMNLLLMGKEAAESLGTNVKAVTLSLLTVTSFMVSGTVCLAGLVGFVGLVIPHLLRLILGADHRILTPACFLGGASFMVGCDLLARALPTSGEMPVGVVTALIGAPAFIFLLYRTKA